MMHIPLTMYASYFLLQDLRSKSLFCHMCSWGRGREEQDDSEEEVDTAEMLNAAVEIVMQAVRLGQQVAGMLRELSNRLKKDN